MVGAACQANVVAGSRKCISNEHEADGKMFGEDEGKLGFSPPSVAACGACDMPKIELDLLNEAALPPIGRSPHRSETGIVTDPGLFHTRVPLHQRSPKDCVL